MASTIEMVRSILLPIAGISAIAWVIVGVAYRLITSRKSKVGYFDVDKPSRHKIAFWIIIFGLALTNGWMFLSS